MTTYEELEALYGEEATRAAGHYPTPRYTAPTLPSRAELDDENIEAYFEEAREMETLSEITIPRTIDAQEQIAQMHEDREAAQAERNARREARREARELCKSQSSKIAQITAPSAARLTRQEKAASESLLEIKKNANWTNRQQLKIRHRQILSGNAKPGKF